MTTQRFQILGMHCVGCAMAINAALKELSGVKSTSASYAEHIAEVEYDPSQMTVARIVIAINEVGYGARLVDG